MSVTNARYKCFPLNGWAVSSLMLGCLLAIGCGESTSSPSSNPTQSQSNQPQLKTAESEPDLVATAQFKQKLIGVWLGEAFVDEARLFRKIQSLPAEQQEATLHLAEEFLSTVMAVDFRWDGTLETEIEVARLDSQPIREGGPGNWRVLETSPGAAVIETTTRLADGSTITDQQRYQFGVDSNRVEILIDLGIELDGCGSSIVLHRQPTPDVNVAEQSGSTQVK